MPNYDHMTAEDLIDDVREEMLREQAEQDAWDAGMTPAERQAAIAEEVRRTEAREGAGTLPHSWTDPRTANLNGNYVTR